MLRHLLFNLAGFLPIEKAPRDGTLVILVSEGHPEFGAQVMGWSHTRCRWEGQAFALMLKVPTWWDEFQPQPTHFKHTQ